MICRRNIFIVLIFCFIKICISEPGIDPPTLQEIKILKEFKKIAEGIATHKYQTEDGYLLNWLRGSNMDIENAKRRFEKSMEWRRDFKMDSVFDDPEMKKMKRILKYSIDTVDVHGHPVLDYSGGQWNIRKLVLSGKSEIFLRYWSSLFEAGIQKIREMNENGKNISSFVHIMDSTGYSLRNSACLACLPVIARITAIAELNYASFFHSNIIVNAPRTFNVALDFSKPFISPFMAKALKVLGNDPIENKEYLSKLFDMDQLRRIYGGNRKNEL